jgi:2-(1,2-epoxy-1,2-dihydrophenyl)acetyl-CoA isomerase
MSMTSSSPPLLVSRDRGIARLRFNRPEVLNAINAEVARAFHAACEALANDPSVRVVVMTGAGRAFVSGGDLGAFRQDPAGTAPALIEPMHQALALLADIGAPVVASLHGAVAGAGLSLAAAADLAIAAEGTRFNLAYVNVGTSCDLGASWSLPRLVGLRKALEIALLGETLTADEALRVGLVNRVVPAVSLEVETETLVRRLAERAPIALRHIKRLMRESFGRDLRTQLDCERDAFCACAATEDFKEALEAFFEKRPGRYVGR